MKEFSSIEDILLTEGIVSSDDVPTMHLIAHVAGNRIIIEGIEGFSVDLDNPELNLIDITNAFIGKIDEPRVVGITPDDSLASDERAVEIFRKASAFVEKAVDARN